MDERRDEDEQHGGVCDWGWIRGDGSFHIRESVCKSNRWNDFSVADVEAGELRGVDVREVVSGEVREGEEQSVRVRSESFDGKTI